MSMASKIQSVKTHFTATETYKYWSGFDKNYNASVMKLKKVVSLWFHQELKIRTWKSQPDFLKFCHRDSVPWSPLWVLENFILRASPAWLTANCFLLSIKEQAKARVQYQPTTRQSILIVLILSFHEVQPSASHPSCRCSCQFPSAYITQQFMRASSLFLL